MSAAARRLDPKLIDEFRRQLLEGRAALLRTVAIADDELAGLEAPGPGDSTDRSAAASTAALVSRLAGQDKLELDEIAQALRRLGSGAYGTCESCREHIALPRLRAVPAARFCRPCSGSRGGGAMIARGILLISVVLLASCAHAQDGRALVDRGRMVFRDQGCYGCHTAEGMGTPIGPDLSRIGAKRNETDLARWLRDPSTHRPSAHMPKIQLTEAEVQALTAYLGSLR